MSVKKSFNIIYVDMIECFRLRVHIQMFFYRNDVMIQQYYSILPRAAEGESLSY